MAVHTKVSVLSHVLHLSYCLTFWCSAPLWQRARHGVRDRWALLHQPLLPDGKQLRSCQCWTNVKEWLTTKLLQGGTLHARRESCSLRSLQQQHRGEDFKIYNLDQLKCGSFTFWKSKSSIILYRTVHYSSTPSSTYELQLNIVS